MVSFYIMYEGIRYIPTYLRYVELMMSYYLLYCVLKYTTSKAIIPLEENYFERYIYVWMELATTFSLNLIHLGTSISSLSHTYRQFHFCLYYSHIFDSHVVLHLFLKPHILSKSPFFLATTFSISLNTYIFSFSNITLFYHFHTLYLHHLFLSHLFLSHLFLSHFFLSHLFLYHFFLYHLFLSLSISSLIFLSHLFAV